MLSRIVKLLPRDLLVLLYRRFPFKRLRNWIAYRAQQRFLVAVLGIFTNEHNEVLLLKHTYRNEPWGVPGGWLELEDPKQGLIREVEEETGLEVIIEKPYIVEHKSNPTRIDIIYEGKFISGQFKACAEISEIQFCSFEDLPEGLPAEQKDLLIQFSKQHRT